MKNTQLKDFIRVFPELFPKTFCDEIIEEYKTNLWAPSKVGDHQALTETRNSVEIFISHHLSIEQNKEKRLHIDDKIYKLINSALVDYQKKFDFFSIKIDTGYNLLKYEKNGKFKEHIDDPFTYNVNEHGVPDPDTFVRRQISAVVLLNNEFKGGELSFFRDTYRPTLKTGSCVLFPSNCLFPHQVLPVQEGERYSMVTWFKN